MIRKLICAAGIAAALSAVPASAKDPVWPADKLGKEATIPFMDTIGLYNFEADDDRGVWLQDQQRRWYYATVVPPCTNLSFATRIGVDTRFGGSTLDRTGSLLVDHQSCHLTSLVTSNGPPPKVKKPKKG
jgi:hypothetical protein